MIRSAHVSKLARDCNLGLEFDKVIWSPGAVSGNEAAIVAAVVPDTTAGNSKDLTVAANPDVPRTLNCEVSTDADGDLTAKFQIWGTDFWGNQINETVAGVTLAGGVVATNYAYRTVTDVTVITDTASDVDAADRVRVGYGPELGLPVKIKDSGDLHAVYEGDLQSGTGDAWTALTLVTSGLGSGEYTLDTTYQTFQPGDAPDGSLDYRVTGKSTLDLEGLDE